jgi:hypothetical protein
MQLKAIWDYALQYCINKGLTKEEIDFYKVVPNLSDITNEIFLSELAWCVYNSGMKMEVIRKKWPALKKAFHNFDPYEIMRNIADCVNESLEIFNHPGKAGAVIDAGYKIIQDSNRGCIGQKLAVMSESAVLDYLQTYPYIGKVTKYHLAKNLGFDVVKPDRHLVRLAEFLKYDGPDSLVTEIKVLTGERKAYIDFILWRWLSWQGKEAYEVITNIILEVAK